MTPIKRRHTIYFKDEKSMNNFIDSFMQKKYEKDFNEIVEKGVCKWNHLGMLVHH